MYTCKLGLLLSNFFALNLQSNKLYYRFVHLKIYGSWEAKKYFDK